MWLYTSHFVFSPPVARSEDTGMSVIALRHGRIRLIFEIYDCIIDKIHDFYIPIIDKILYNNNGRRTNGPLCAEADYS